MFWSKRTWEPPFVALEQASDIEAWLAKDGANLVFLHDPYCPISKGAFQEMANLPGPIGLVDVSAHADLADVVEGLTAVRHESPQAIVVRDKQVVWSASHYLVRKAALTAALDGPTEADSESS